MTNKHFIHGQILNINQLNHLDLLIQQLKYDSSKLNELIEFWDTNFNDQDDNHQISDEIKSIQEKINEYI